MLSLHESIALHQVLVILNGVDIDIAKLTDLVLQTADLTFHSRQIIHLFVAESCRIA